MTIKNRIFLISTILVVSVLFFSDLTFAETLKYDMNQNISDDKFSNSWLISMFSWYYKWIILWLTVLNVIVSMFIWLKLISSSDRDEMSKNKQSLMKVNLAYLSLVFLWFIIIFVISILSWSMQNGNVRWKDNSLVMWGWLYSDVSPFSNDDVAIYSSIQQIKSNSAILASFWEDFVNSSEENQQVVLQYQNTYNKVTRLLDEEWNTDASDFLTYFNSWRMSDILVNKVEASEIINNSLKDRVIALKESWKISNEEYNIFNKALTKISSEVR